MCGKIKKIVKAGDKLYTGKIVTDFFASHYNYLQNEVDKKNSLNIECEALKNAKHMYFVCFAAQL